MSYENLFAAHVLPVARFKKRAEGEYEPIEAVGSGFTFGEGTFVTCWHCVSAVLEKGEVYGAAMRSEGVEGQKYDEVFELAYLERDVNGADLALARVGYSLDPVLPLGSEPAIWGEDVVASGYPLPVNTRDPETKQVKIDMNSCMLRGYVTRLRMHDRLGWPTTRAYELDMIAPPGLSGSPLFLPQPLEVIGVVYGEQDVQAGQRQPVTFAYAHHLSVLREARASVTGGKPLHEFLAEQHKMIGSGEDAGDPQNGAVTMEP